MQMPVHIVGAGGFVENQHGQILLVKDRRGGWVFPGGQVEVGENLIDGLTREIKEESGIMNVIQIETITLDRYSHLLPGLQEAAAAKFDELVRLPDVHLKA